MDSYSLFFDEISTKMYPSTLLHSYGVNGKISGSVGAVGEMGDGVVAILHSPIGCGFHYRYSARRRHQPFYALLTTDLTEEEIVFGGTDKLRRTVLDAWARYRPKLILIIPSPISDILNDDILSVARELRQQGLPVAAVRSELFSHRDKNYAKNRLKELSKQKLGADNKLEMELKGCGFTEALYAIVEQVMEPRERIPRSINIETVGWGSEGRLALREIEAFLGRVGIAVNAWIPSSSIEALKGAPAAELNLVKRIRWAKRMKEKFGTDYLFMNNPGRYEGLDGIALFYREIAEKLNCAEEMEAVLQRELEETRKILEPVRARTARHSCALVCRGLQTLPFTLRTYAREFGVGVHSICVCLTEQMRLTSGMTPEVEQNLMGRARDAIEMYSPGTELYMNPTRDEMRGIFAKGGAVVGSNDCSLEGLGAPLIPAVSRMSSPTFESCVRNAKRFLTRLENAQERTELLLNRMPFDTDRYPRIETQSSRAARDLWEKMWLDRKREV